MKKLLILFVMTVVSTLLMAQKKEVDWYRMITFDYEMVSGNMKLELADDFSYIVTPFQWDIHLGPMPAKKKDPMPPTVSTENFGFLIQKNNSEGALWSKVIHMGDRQNSDNMSGMFNAITDIKAVSGFLYLTGSFESSIDFGDGITLKSEGKNDMFVAKLSTDDGKTQWAMRAGGSGNVYAEMDPGGQTITADLSGNVFVGATLNAYPKGGGTYGDGQPLELSEHGGTFTLFKFNPEGEVQWFKKAPAGTFAPNQDMTLDGYGNIYISGSAQFFFEWDGNKTDVNGMRDAVVLKLDNDGKYIWSKVIGGGEDGKTMDNETVGNMSVSKDGRVNTYIQVYKGAKLNGVEFDVDSKSPLGLTSTVASFDADGNVTSTAVFDGKWMMLPSIVGGAYSDNFGNIHVTVNKGIEVNGEKSKVKGIHSFDIEGNSKFLYSSGYDDKVFAIVYRAVAISGENLYGVGRIMKASELFSDLGLKGAKVLEKQEKNYKFDNDLKGILVIKYKPKG